MTYYEIKKIFSKKANKIALILMLAILAVIIYFIMGENTYINKYGDEEKGLAATAKVRD